MTQFTELPITNQSGLQYRTKVNSVLSAINSDNAGEIAPTVTEAYMTWLDTSVSPAILRRRNSSNTGWDVADPLKDDLANVVDYTKGAALVGGVGRVVSTISELKTLPTTGSPNAFVTGYYAAGDGGGGHYWYDSSDTTSSDNGGTVIVATDGGRWKLVATDSISVKQFGAKGDSVTDDYSAIQAALNAAPSNGTVLLPEGGTFLFNSQLTIPSGVTFKGSGSRVFGLLSNVIGSPSINIANGYYSAIENINISHATPASANTSIQLTDNDGDGTGSDPAQYFRMRQIRITNHATGIRIAKESTWCVFEDVVVTGNTGTAFSLSLCNFAQFERCIADSNSSGWFLDGTLKVILNACTAQVCSSTTTAAVSILNADNTEINHLWCERNEFHNVHIRGTSRMTRISEMLNQGAGFTSLTGRGIYVDGTSSNTIIDGGYHGGNATNDISIGNTAVNTIVIAPRSNTTLVVSDLSSSSTWVSSGQFKFPSTQMPSSDVNTLDDYREGVWTPVLSTTGVGFTSVTYDPVTGGRYTKIGSLVHVQGVVRTDAVTVGAATGGVIIGGLPFTAASNSGSTANGSCTLNIGYSVDFLGEEPTSALINAGTTTAALHYRNAADGNSLSLQVSDLDTGINKNYFYFSGTYIAAA